MKHISSYLTERQYITDSNSEYSGQKYTYWSKMLGKNAFQRMLNNFREFEGYLKQLDYTVKTDDTKNQNVACGLSESLMSYIESALEEDKKISYTKFGTRQLKQRLKDSEEFLSEGVYSDFSNHLNVQLQAVYMRVFIINLHESKRDGLLKGADTKEEYEYFCEHIANDAQSARKLFERYPVLYRCMEEKIGQMVDYYEEIFGCFRREREDISKVLCEGREVRRIIKINGGFSDVHNQGKQVLRIGLDNGAEILYKPHSMENEEMYHRLLRKLAEMTGILQYEYPFLSYEDHSWSTIVPYQTCESEEGLRRYYQRLGVQIFLTYLLGTKDLHSENVIACGEYPVLIDLETLVNITFNRERTSANEEICYRLAQSVLYTGLLPFYSWSYNGEGVNNSAISGAGGQAYPFRVPRIVNAGTSEMSIDYCYPESEGSENLATVNGTFISPSAYSEELLAGFCRAYQAALEGKEEFNALLEGLRGTRSRYLLADTQRYAMLLSGSYHPSLLLDGADREIFLWSMWNGRPEEEKDIIKSEVADLLGGDVPYFSYRLDRTSLYDSRGKAFEDYFEKPAMDILQDRLAALDEEDLDKQCGYIRLALKLMPENAKDCMNRAYPVKDILKERKGKRDKASVCRALADRLLGYAVWNQDRTQVSWFKVLMSAYGKQTWNITPMDMYLYDGLAGMLLIFSALEKTDKRAEVRDIAVTLEHMLFRYTEAGNESLNNLDTKNTGAYEGESSILYTYLLLYRQTGKDRYLKYAKSHAKIVEKLLKDDSKYDLLSGNAGAAAVLLKLYEITLDSSYLNMAEYAVDILAENAVKQETGIGWHVEKGIPPMAGMAHGNSGALMAVTALWKHTGREKYQKLAREIWAYEDTLYDPEKNNWRDVRGEDEKDTIGAVAWCHGAAGVLMSRMYCYQNACTNEWKELMRRDMERACKKVKDYWLRDSYCLCHGTCGNLWILKEARKIMGEDKETVPYDAADHVRLLPQEEINPGFMNGYGGVLYYLLWEG